MLKIVETILDTLFPPRDSERLVRDLLPQDIARLLHIQTLTSFIALSNYNDPIIQALIKENKFRHNLKAATLLAVLLKVYLEQSPSKRFLITCIPLGNTRRRTRGHNQVETIVQNLPSGSAETNFSLLKRTKETPPQTELPRAKRLKNLHQAFTFTGEVTSFTNFDTLILLDDVGTTGTTLAEARATLAPHLPPHITLVCIALAH